MGSCGVNVYAILISSLAAALCVACLALVAVDSVSHSRHNASRRRERRAVEGFRTRRRLPSSPAPPPPPPTLSSSPRRLPPTLRIMSWNVFMRPDVLGDSQELRRDLIADAIVAASPDIIVLQEAFSRHARDMVSRLRVKGWYWKSRALSPGPTQLAEGGVVILSKLPIIASSAGVFSHRNASTSDAFAAKGVVYAKLRLSSSTSVNVFGTHLQAGGDGASAAVRKKQLEEVARFVRRCTSSTEPVVVCGDFNTSPFSDALRTFRLEAGLVVAAGTSADAPTMDPTSNYLVGCDGDGADIFERSPMFPCLKGCQRDVLDFFLVRTVPSVTFTVPSISPLRPLAPHPYPFHLGFTRQLSDHYPVLLDMTHYF